MSNLKILVCTFLFAVTSWTESTAVADHGWPSNQGFGCGRAGGYFTNQNTDYRPLVSSHGYLNNNGYGFRSTPQNYGLRSHGVSGHGGVANGNFAPNRSFDPRLGANFPAYQNLGRTGNLIYDNAHGDYHTIPGGVSQQYQGNSSGGARNPYQNNSSNSPWFGGSSGW